MKYRAIAAAAIVAAVSLTVAGCSSGTSGSGSSAAAGTTITYWSSQQGTSLATTKTDLAPIIKKFTEETGVKVNVEVIGWNDLQTREQTAITSGVGPDVMNIGNTWSPTWQATGAFLPFDSANMKAIGGSSKFVPAALETGGVAGKDYTSVPIIGLAYGLFYNKAMFSAAGLTPPTTWEELVTDAQKLTSPSTGVYGMGLEAGSYTENVHFAFMNGVQNGGEWFNSKGDPTFTSAANVDGVLRYLDLMQTDKVVSTSNAQYSNGTEASADFAKGKVAMIVNQNNANSSLQADGMSVDKYGVVPIPSPSNAVKKIGSGVNGINVSIMKNTKHKDASLEFVKFLTSPWAQKEMAEPFSSIPTLKGLKANFAPTPDQITTFSHIYNNLAVPYPLATGEASFETTVGNAVNTLFANIATGQTVTSAEVKAALSTAEQKTAANG
jgi:multiple sugar transport system substrate-binding protein